MGLSATIANVIEVANRVTADLQDTCTLTRYTGVNAFSEPTFAAGISVQALVEYKQERVRAASGDDILSSAKITIFGPVTAEGSANRREPIDPRDKITLPDGEIATPIDVEGLGRPSTNAPYMLEVWLTKGGAGA